MRTLIRASLCLALALLTPALSLAQDSQPTTATRPDKQEPVAKGYTGRPFLYTIEHQGTTSYLFGTMHLPDKRVVKLPAVVEEAWKKADAVITEIDIAAFRANPAAAMKVQAMVKLPNNGTLKDHLSEKALAKLDPMLDQVLRAQIAAQLGGQIDPAMEAQLAGFVQQAKGNMLSMKPSFLAAELSLYPYLGQTDAAGKPLVAMDERFSLEASQQGRETGGLEQLEDQIKALDVLDMATQVKVLEATILELADPKKSKQEAEELVGAYLRGDEKKVREVMSEQMADTEYMTEEQAKQLTKSLLTDRDTTMEQGIVKLLSENPKKVYFVAVGCAHVVGENGLVVRLNKVEGISVKRINPGAGAGKAGEKKPAGAGAAPGGKKSY